MGRKVKYKVSVWCYDQHTCLFLAFCSLLSPSSSSSIGRLSSAASCRRNSHRHCTGSTSKDPSLDWTKSANHGMDWEEACAGLKIHHSYRTHTEGKSRRIICSFFLFEVKLDLCSWPMFLLPINHSIDWFPTGFHQLKFSFNGKADSELQSRIAWS